MWAPETPRPPMAAPNPIHPHSQPPRPRVVDDLGRAVISVRQRVTEFLGGSELVFLETGNALERLRSQATELVATAAAVVEGAHPGGQEPVERLARGCRQMDQHIASSQQALEAKSQRLRAVLVALDRLGSFRLLFRRAGSALRMLGMSTEIENARRENQSTGFATVAGDVRRLGSLIESKLDGVLGEALLMKRTAEEALARVTDLRGRQDGRASAILSDASAGLESLRGLARAAAVVGAKTSAGSREIVESVGRVVVSLQAHDIARQMLEHVVEGLSEVDAELSRAPAADLPAAAAEVSGDLDLGGAVDLCRLQASQMRQARSRLEKALNQIPTNLRGMSVVVRALGEQTSRLAASPHGGSSLAEVERGVARAGAALREQLQQEAGIERAMTTVMAAIGDMLKRMRDVERIGKELKIIGLNAGVEAAKNTDGGRVMSVLARTIQELSTEVGDHTAAFATVVREIANQARSSDGDGEASAQAGAGATDQSAGEDLARELEGLLVDLRAYSGGLNQAIAALAQGGEVMTRAVDEVSQRVRGQLAATAAMASAEAELDGAQAAVAPLVSSGAGSGAGAPPRRLGVASSRYTIEAERAVHRAVLGGAAPAPAPAPAVPGTGDPELGDNVELF